MLRATSLPCLPLLSIGFSQPLTACRVNGDYLAVLSGPASSAACIYARPKYGAQIRPERRFCLPAYDFQHGMWSEAAMLPTAFSKEYVISKWCQSKMCHTFSQDSLSLHWTSIIYLLLIGNPSKLQCHAYYLSPHPRLK